MKDQTKGREGWDVRSLWIKFKFYKNFLIKPDNFGNNESDVLFDEPFVGKINFILKSTYLVFKTVEIRKANVRRKRVHDFRVENYALYKKIKNCYEYIDK